MSSIDGKQKGAAKTSRAFGKATIPIVPAERLKKPEWIRVKLGDTRRFQEIKDILREHELADLRQHAVDGDAVGAATEGLAHREA